jgi:Autotransporter beta-domain
MGQGSSTLRAMTPLEPSCLHGERGTDQFFGSLAFTYNKKIDSLTLSPYLKARAEHTIADAYAEDGGFIWALAYDKMDSTSVNDVAGFNAELEIPASWGVFTAKGGAEYSTQVVGDYSQGIRYADGAGNAFPTTDAGTNTDQFTASAGVALEVDQLNLDLLYQYSLANHNSESHAISGTVRYSF